MDLKQLEYFTAIVDSGSVSEAARRLHMSQPPLSYQMKLLESELGVSLYSRTVRGIELTDAGRLLYEHATHLLNYSKSTKREVSMAGKRSVLRLGMSSSAVADILPVLHKFGELHPEARFEIQDGNTFQLLDLLSQHVIEGAVVRTPVKLPKVNKVVLAHEKMVAAWKSEEGEAAAFSPVAEDDAREATAGEASSRDASSRAAVSLKDLSARPLLLYRRYYDFLLSAFHTHNLEPDVYCLCDDARDVLQWAKEGMGTVVFPESMRSMCEGLTVAEVDEASLQTEVLFVWSSETQPGPLLAELCRILKAEAL